MTHYHLRCLRLPLLLWLKGCLSGCFSWLLHCSEWTACLQLSGLPLCLAASSVKKLAFGSTAADLCLSRNVTTSSGELMLSLSLLLQDKSHFNDTRTSRALRLEQSSMACAFLPCSCINATAKMWNLHAIFLKAILIKCLKGAVFHTVVPHTQRHCISGLFFFFFLSGASCRVWLPYLNPIFWTVYGLIESQVDNLDALVTLTNQQQVPVYEAVEMLFGYQ